MITTSMQVKSHTVHVDIVMDVMSVLFDNEIPFVVEGINTDEQTIILRSTSQTKRMRHTKAMENIKVILSNYSYYRHGSESGNNIGLGLDETM